MPSVVNSAPRVIRKPSNGVPLIVVVTLAVFPPSQLISR